VHHVGDDAVNVRRQVLGGHLEYRHLGTQRVAVVGWQWYQSKEESKAVILISVTMWQWQYWQSCGGLKNVGGKKREKKRKKKKGGVWRQKGVDSGMGGGSGWVAVVPLERGEQGGHFGISYNVTVAVLAELWWFEKCGGKKERKK
jgi:hypothetical protein